MKIEILVDGEVIHTEQAGQYYANEYHEARNTLASYLGVHLGEVNPSMERLIHAVYMITKYGWTVAQVRKELWGR